MPCLSSSPTRCFFFFFKSLRNRLRIIDTCAKCFKLSLICLGEKRKFSRNTAPNSIYEYRQLKKKRVIKFVSVKKKKHLFQHCCFHKRTSRNWISQFQLFLSLYIIVTRWMKLSHSSAKEYCSEYLSSVFVYWHWPPKRTRMISENLCLLSNVYKRCWRCIHI